MIRNEVFETENFLSKVQIYTIKRTVFKTPFLLFRQKNVRRALAEPGGLCNAERGSGLSASENVASHR